LPALLLPLGSLPGVCLLLCYYWAVQVHQQARQDKLRPQRPVQQGRVPVRWVQGGMLTHT
jgi:hypothetical protein